MYRLINLIIALAQLIFMSLLTGAMKIQKASVGVEGHRLFDPPSPRRLGEAMANRTNHQARSFNRKDQKKREITLDQIVVCLPVGGQCVCNLVRIVSFDSRSRGVGGLSSTNLKSCPSQSHPSPPATSIDETVSMPGRVRNLQFLCATRILPPTFRLSLLFLP